MKYVLTVEKTDDDRSSSLSDGGRTLSVGGHPRVVSAIPAGPLLKLALTAERILGRTMSRNPGDNSIEATLAVNSDVDLSEIFEIDGVDGIALSGNPRMT